MKDKITQISFPNYNEPSTVFSVQGTPNCEICKWRRVFICDAQGRKATDNCYNTETCQSLFEVKDEPT